MKKPKTKPFQWRNSKQLRGVASQLIFAIRGCTNGAYVALDIRTAKNLLEICHQAIHTEVGHEPSPTELAEAGREITRLEEWRKAHE